MNKNSIKLAYLGGLIDGEGCITITRNKGQRKNYDYQLNLRISMLDRKPIKLFADIFSTNVLRHRNHDKAFWTCILVANKAANALDKVLPYLISKREVANLGIEFQRTKKDGRKIRDETTGQYVRLSGGEQDFRKMFYDKAQVLVHRFGGRKPVESL